MPFISLPTLTVHYEHSGSGNTVLVLIHGNFSSWRWWQPLLQHLPVNYRAYVPELRGFGETDHPAQGYTIEQLADDLHELVTVLHLPTFHLVGHSLGAAVALQFALNQPLWVRSLTLVSPAPAEGMSHLPSLPRWSKLPSVTSLSPLISLFNDVPRMAPQAIMGLTQSLSTWNVQAQLPTLSLPVLMLWGERDLIVPRAPLERMASALPNAQFITWPGVGHAPQLEQPERFTKLLLKFIKST